VPVPPSVRGCQSERGARGSRGSDGGAEEAGEQVQGAGRQAAAGADPTPEHPILPCSPRSRELVSRNVLRGCRQDMAARFTATALVLWLDLVFRCEFSVLGPCGSASSAVRAWTQGLCSTPCIHGTMNEIPLCSSVKPCEFGVYYCEL
jgi:hypothetical protein